MFEDSRMLSMILTENAKLLEDGIIWATQLWMTVKLLCRRFNWSLHLNTTGSGGHNSVQYSAQLYQVGYGGSGVMQQTVVQ